MDMRRPRSIISSLGTVAVLGAVTAAPATAREVYSPDARDANRVATTAQETGSHTVYSPDARDANEGRTPFVVVVDGAATKPSSESSSSRFEWSDAGIGGGVVLALALGGAGTALSVRRHHRHAPLAH
jgi:hypothetical protein